MPIYDYACKRCEHEFQIRESISDHERSAPRCPECGSEELRRVFVRAFVKTGKKS